MAFDLCTPDLGRCHLPRLHDGVLPPFQVLHPCVTINATAWRDCSLDLVGRQNVETSEQVRQLKLSLRGGTWRGDSGRRQAESRTPSYLVPEVGLSVLRIDFALKVGAAT